MPSAFHNAASRMLIHSPEAVYYQNLVGPAAHILSSAWRPLTVRSYSTGQKKYIEFAIGGGFQPFPLTPTAISLWVASLNNLAPGSIKVYLSAVRSLAKLYGFPESP